MKFCLMEQTNLNFQTTNNKTNCIIVSISNIDKSLEKII